MDFTILLISRALYLYKKIHLNFFLHMGFLVLESFKTFLWFFKFI